MKRKHASTLARAAALCIVSGLLSLASACAHGADPEAMAVSKSDVPSLKGNKSLENGIGIKGEVAGGQDTNPAWTSEISGDAFKDALTQSLKSMGYLAA